MGVWGTGIYDNDDAADWKYGLVERGFSALEEALEPIPTDHYMDSFVGSAAIAAADVVARLATGGGETTAYSEGVQAWVDQNRTENWSHLVGPALAALDRVRLDHDSELRFLWADSDSLAEWLATVAEIEQRLRSAS